MTEPPAPPAYRAKLLAKVEAMSRALIRRGEYLQGLELVARRDDEEGRSALETLEKELEAAK